MILEEALVIFACMNSTGCAETSSQYYVVHPEVKRYIQHKENAAKNYVGPGVIETIGPFVYVAMGGTGNLRISKNFSFQLKREESMLTFRKDF